MLVEVKSEAFEEQKVNYLLDSLTRFTHGFSVALTLETLDIEGVRFAVEDHEGGNGDVTLLVHQFLVEPGQGLDEDVGALVAELVAPGREQVNRLVKIKVQVTIEMPVHELLNLGFAIRMLRLKFSR